MPLSSITGDDGGYIRQGTIAEIQVVNALCPSVALDDVKVPVDKTETSDDHRPMVESTRGPSISTSADHASDSASIHSMPAVPVTGPSNTPDQSSPVFSEDARRASRASPSSPTGTNVGQVENSYQRRARHRSTIESRSTNRLSGFFTNFINRREPTPAPTRDSVREVVSHSEPARPNSEEASRGSSPTPPRPASPPPPSLPAPTLQELGLSLSALTTDLCPSHFTSPPSNGAFLAPHYLLLCHAQGLDVLPLSSPPVIQPYALVRRVNFKSLVVMEHRGVLVAIAGRRDGVRVYALEEVRKAIEWRIDVEIKRERDRQRRETAKKMSTADNRESNQKHRKSSVSYQAEEPEPPLPNLLPKISHRNSPAPSAPPPVPLIPRAATRKKKSKNTVEAVGNPTQPSGHPPPYAGPTEITSPPLQSQRSYVSLSPGARGSSVGNVLAQVASQQCETSRNQDNVKTNWADSSDEEAIDAVAAGPSGSHLDERTSAAFSATADLSITSPRLGHPQAVSVSVPTHLPTTSSTTGRRHRPANLDLSAIRPNAVPPPEASPTLLSLRQALQAPVCNDHPTTASRRSTVDIDDDDDELDGQISLAQALFESRLPDLPPIGSRRPQEPILITPIVPSARSSQVTPTPSVDGDSRGSLGRSHSLTTATRRRRRWSIMIGSRTTESDLTPASAPPTRPPSRSERPYPNQPTPAARRTFAGHVPVSETLAQPLPVSNSSRTSRFIPRMISNVLHGRSSDDRPTTSASLPELSDGSRWTPSVTYQIPPPKLEYVKLPGTKGAVIIKAVETAKKSFLAILCGEHGEKVELFAGTYRTALGLSRTFILPDSPRTLELQLQGDDLVEVFLVFSQNVFGLEPATVRVREIRIGRAERRAARRRARENRHPGRNSDAQANDAEPDEDTNVISIGVSVPVASHSGLASPLNSSNEHSEGRPTSPDPAPGSSGPQGEESVLFTTAQMGPYTTFQQLDFAPRFPLASISDEFIIPPTYAAVLEYKARYEMENEDMTPVETQAHDQPHFTPPGLPVPTPAVPPKWFYRDPKNIIHGPWKASLMQAWYKDGLLPPDLPVRREEDTEFVLLRELRLKCVDPTQPFRNVPPVTTSLLTEPPPPAPKPQKPLLAPISLLKQPKHFGPPALFFSSRGGHSTGIVDSRGRSVLKGKFFWSGDDDERHAFSGKLGDIKRLEAFDISERSLLVALRQGGLEVVDLGDALLRPADESRPNLPNYVVPHSSIGRRAPFIWKIGSPISSSASTLSSVLTTKGKGAPGHSSGKKTSSTSAKFANGRSDAYGIDSDGDQQEEVLYLGRNGNEVYFCERNATSFRIIRLSPTS